MPGLTAAELFDAAEITPNGTISWEQDVPITASGVYVITVPDAATTTFLDVPALDEDRARWVGDQDIVYIGRASVLARRLRQFRKHVYGARSPHRGGQAILLLDAPKTIRWAAVEDYGAAEDRLLAAFQKKVGRMPFGNRVRSARMKKAVLVEQAD